MVSQIIGVSSVFSTVCSGTDTTIVVNFLFWFCIHQWRITIVNLFDKIYIWYWWTLNSSGHYMVTIWSATESWYSIVLYMYAYCRGTTLLKQLWQALQKIRKVRFHWLSVAWEVCYNTWRIPQMIFLQVVNSWVMCRWGPIGNLFCASPMRIYHLVPWWRYQM